MMNPSEIKSAIESRLSDNAVVYWQNTMERNDYIVLAQQEGIEKAIQAIESDAEPIDCTCWICLMAGPAKQ